MTGIVLTALLVTGTVSAWADPIPDESLGRKLLSEAALEQAVLRGEVQGRAPRADEESRQDRRFARTALEIAGFEFLLNRFDNRFIGPEYDVSLASIRRNLHSSWMVDHDPFSVNQLGHPYQGMVYYGLARSNGFNFWESFGFTFAGSAIWEIAGETMPPSKNDQITTSIGGAFLGESLFRMAHLMLEHGTVLLPRWRELAAAAISPPLGFHRAIDRERLSEAFISNSPAIYSRLQAGFSGTLTSHVGRSLSVKENEAALDFSLDYGLPGKPGYQYRRPFDYFSLQFRASSVGGVESLTDRGLILGSSYEAGSALRGIWGLYGGFDYLAPQIFRISSTGLSLGSTAQWRLSQSVALQVHGSAGVGYTSTGTIRSSADRDYNYGFAPQALLAMRLILGNAASFDVTAREYFAGRLARSDTGGTDHVLRGEAALTVRLRRNHAIALKYITSRRNASFADLGSRSQRQDTLGIYYTFQPADGFGAVRW